LNVIEKDPATNLNKYSTELSYSVYTNLNNHIVIESNDESNSNAEVSVYNTIGEKLYASKINNQLFTIKKDFKTGMLIVKISTLSKESTYKLFIR